MKFFTYDEFSPFKTKEKRTSTGTGKSPSGKQNTSPGATADVALKDHDDETAFFARGAVAPRMEKQSRDVKDAPRLFGLRHSLAGPGGQVCKTINLLHRHTGTCSVDLHGYCSRLYQQWFSKNNRDLALCGASPACGTSFLAAKLAIAFSRHGLRTLLVDANLRSAKQHIIFGLPENNGISSLLTESATDATIWDLEMYPNLSVLTAGTPMQQPELLFISTQFDYFLEEIRQEYDVILYDCPSLKCSGNMYLISIRINGVVLVCRKNITLAHDVREASLRLNYGGSRMVSAIMNRF
jgi:capsular exopolysaccharide synthesis family protein